MDSFEERLARLRGNVETLVKCCSSCGQQSDCNDAVMECETCYSVVTFACAAHNFVIPENMTDCENCSLERAERERIKIYNEKLSAAHRQYIGVLHGTNPFSSFALQVELSKEFGEIEFPFHSNLNFCLLKTTEIMYATKRVNTDNCSNYIPFIKRKLYQLQVVFSEINQLYYDSFYAKINSYLTQVERKKYEIDKDLISKANEKNANLCKRNHILLIFTTVISLIFTGVGIYDSYYGFIFSEDNIYNGLILIFFALPSCLMYFIVKNRVEYSEKIISAILIVQFIIILLLILSMAFVRSY